MRAGSSVSASGAPSGGCPPPPHPRIRTRWPGCPGPGSGSETRTSCSPVIRHWRDRPRLASARLRLRVTGSRAAHVCVCGRIASVYVNDSPALHSLHNACVCVWGGAVKQPHWFHRFSQPADGFLGRRLPARRKSRPAGIKPALGEAAAFPLADRLLFRPNGGFAGRLSHPTVACQCTTAHSRLPARRTGRQITWREDAGLALAGGFAQAIAP